MSVVKVRGPHNTRLLSAASFAELVASCRRLFACDGAVHFELDGDDVLVGSDEEWALAQRVGAASLRFVPDAPADAPPAYEVARAPAHDVMKPPPAAPPSLAERLRRYATQRERLALLSELIELRAEDVLPCLALFPDEDAAALAAEVLLRLAYRLVLPAAVVLRLVRRFARRKNCDWVLARLLAVDFELTDRELLDAAGSFGHYDGGRLLKFVLQRSLVRFTEQDLVRLLDRAGCPSTRYEWLALVARGLPVLSDVRIAALLEAHFARAPRLRAMAERLLAERC